MPATCAVAAFGNASVASAVRCSRPVAPRLPKTFVSTGPCRAVPSQRARVPMVCRAQQKDSVTTTVNTMLKRYDFVSTGMGALAVTCWFWAHGQQPIVALEIAAVSTIVALVANELFFENSK